MLKTNSKQGNPSLTTSSPTVCTLACPLLWTSAVLLYICMACKSQQACCTSAWHANLSRLNAFAGRQLVTTWEVHCGLCWDTDGRYICVIDDRHVHSCAKSSTLSYAAWYRQKQTMHNVAKQQYMTWYMSNERSAKTSVKERMPESPHHRLRIAAAHRLLIGHLLKLLAALGTLALAVLSEALGCPRSGQRQQLPSVLLAERPQCFVNPVLQHSRCCSQQHMWQSCELMHHVYCLALKI